MRTVKNAFIRLFNSPNLLMYFLADENMQDKSQDECVRRWVKEMAGYADEFNAGQDKSNMWSCLLDDMVDYGCGDADAVRRLAKVLRPLCMSDEGQWNCYKKVMLPTMDAFMNVVEPHGIDVDTEALIDLQAALDQREITEYEDLIQQVPVKVKRRALAEGKELKFSRPAFVVDTLFSKDGFNLTPTVFTKSTRNLPDAEKIPSTSAKEHLPYFDEEPFVVQLMDFQRLQKMRTTYVGKPEYVDDDTGEIIEEASGFFKYIHNGKIHPSFLLHRTNTGRSASAGREQSAVK